MPTVSLRADALDCFNEILTILCRDTLAVTLIPQDGEPFGAVLISHNGETLIYEAWDVAAGLPVGDPRTIAVSTITDVQVF